ncbi:MAG: hypothetical protein IPJ40_16945 [Saprospirales bacterium]|nr:hypothetical protein [Saprospirales bacterium]
MNCLQCGKSFRGRSDKKYCSLPCKNAHYRLRTDPHHEILKKVDAILHRNHAILSQLPWEDKKILTIPKIYLDTHGFNFDFHTGTFTNRHNQLFFYLYNFAWRPHPENKIWIMKNKC